MLCIYQTPKPEYTYARMVARGQTFIKISLIDFSAASPRETKNFQVAQILRRSSPHNSLSNAPSWLWKSDVTGVSQQSPAINICTYAHISRERILCWTLMCVCWTHCVQMRGWLAASIFKRRSPNWAAGLRKLRIKSPIGAFRRIVPNLVIWPSQGWSCTPAA